MLAVGGILTTAVIIAMLELPGLWKKRQVKEIWLFSILLLLGTGVGIAESLHIPLPNPLDWVSYIYRPIGQLLDSALN
ncbi:hypothetical protein [Paenibacillus sp. NPDC057967]|uniref:hypothetical protein n=1 Tax=Paenibacillus sp. NPDC057967 TaxID=3346293 RepID=UPI0036DBE2CB